MDELEISGRRYISSRRAAEEHKYHADYIGQLVRGGKVAGQKVGRAWYVDAESLTEYLGKEAPPRGPMRAIKTETEPELVVKEATPTNMVEIEKEKDEEAAKKEASIPVQVEPEAEPEVEHMFAPFKKTRRQHVIAAIETPTEAEAVGVKYEPAEMEIDSSLKVLADKEIPVSEKENKEEEETYIPLKIKQEESSQSKTIEPEDSFYKVSSKRLRYVAQHTPRSDEENVIITPHVLEPRQKKRTFSYVKAVGAVFAAGIMALGAGVLMSYYLHSITTVQNTGQTSSVILSN